MKNNYYTLVILLFSLSFINIGVAEENNSTKLKKVTTNFHYTKFNINNVSTYIYNNGDADIKPDGNSGFIYPKGTHKAVIFESGFVWGGKIDGKILVGGSTFSSGLQPGKIMDDGKAEDPDSESVRVFRVRPDYLLADLTAEINDGEGTEAQIRDQYAKDWEEWPAEKGAPYKDVDNNNFYNPAIDIPGIAGADQTLWYVANDLDSNVSKSLYGSPTMGVELQVTVWGYKGLAIIENVMFKKYVLINKSKNNFEETYLSVWSDPDLGDAGDDYVGCDTTLSLGYVYNGDDDDGTYGSTPPSVGFKFLQGPIVPGAANDRAKFNGKYLNGKKNLRMTSFPFHGKNSPEYNDPDLGDYFRGTLHFYNMMQGIGSSLGIPTINPITGQASIFAFTGDPITNSGWTNSLTSPPGDKRLAMNSGPFTMASGDTQEVVIAQLAAGGGENEDRLDAVKLLKLYSGLAQNFYDYDFQVTSPVAINSPLVATSTLDREIILSWYDDPDLPNIESFSQIGYKFQGYTIYQYPNYRFDQSEAKEIITYDLNDGIAKVISENTDFSDPSKLYQIEKNGRDLGLQRHFLIDNDLFNSNRPLNNGSKYYFGVSSYAYFSDNSAFIYPKIIESAPFRFSVIPESPKPGNYYAGKYEKILKAVPLQNNSQLDVFIKIVDPTKLNGNKYFITFSIDSMLPDTNYQNIKFSLEDENRNKILDKKKIIIQDLYKSVNPYVVEGFEIEPFEINALMSSNIKNGDEYSFETPKTVIDDNKLAKNEVDKINVFPNPYYGLQDQEVNQYGKFVTFNHLPKKATIRIFNLAGHLITTLEKNDISQFIRWNLTNGRNFWVPSGIYLVYIEMPELNKTKVLKLAVIMETIVPDYF
jgi:hypothetical protein